MTDENRAELRESAERFIDHIRAYMPKGDYCDKDGHYYEAQSVAGYERVKRVNEDRSNLAPGLETASVFDPDLDPGTYLGGKGSPYVWAKSMDERLAQAERMCDEIEAFDGIYRSGAFEEIPQEDFKSLCEMMAAQIAAVRYGDTALTSRDRAADQKLQYECLLKYGQANLIAYEPGEWAVDASRVIEHERLAAAAAAKLDDSRPAVTIGLDDPELPGRGSMPDVVTATRGCFYTTEAAQLYLTETVRDRVSRGQDPKAGLRVFVRDSDPDIQYDMIKAITEAQDRTMPNRRDWIRDRAIQDVYLRTGRNLPMTDPAFPELGRGHRLTTPACPEYGQSGLSNPKLPEYRGFPGSPRHFIALMPGRIERAKTLEQDLAVLFNERDSVAACTPSKATCRKFGWPEEPAKSRMHAALDALTARVLDVEFGPDTARQYLDKGLPGDTYPATAAADIKDRLNRMAEGDNLKSLMDEVSGWRQAAEAALTDESARIRDKAEPVLSVTARPVDLNMPHAGDMAKAAAFAFRSTRLAEMYLQERAVAKQAGAGYGKAGVMAADPSRKDDVTRFVLAAQAAVTPQDLSMTPGYVVRGMTRATEYEPPKPKAQDRERHAEPERPVSSKAVKRPYVRPAWADGLQAAEPKDSPAMPRTEPAARTWRQPTDGAGPFQGPFQGGTQPDWTALFQGVEPRPMPGRGSAQAPVQPADYMPFSGRSSGELDRKARDIGDNVPDLDALGTGLGE